MPHCFSAATETPWPEGLGSRAQTSCSWLHCKDNRICFAFSEHLAPTRCNLSSFREQLKLKEDLNSAIYILFRLYWHVSTHTVKIKSPAEPISRDQCVPILKAKHSRLCQVKIRAKHFILLYFQLLLNIVKQQKGKRFQLCTKSLCSTTSIYAL